MNHFNEDWLIRIPSAGGHRTVIVAMACRQATALWPMQAFARHWESTLGLSFFTMVTPNILRNTCSGSALCPSAIGYGDLFAGTDYLHA
jgi:hypothetical protein